MSPSSIVLSLLRYIRLWPWVSALLPFACENIDTSGVAQFAEFPANARSLFGEELPFASKSAVVFGSGPITITHQVRCVSIRGVDIIYLGALATARGLSEDGNHGPLIPALDSSQEQAIPTAKRDNLLVPNICARVLGGIWNFSFFFLSLFFVMQDAKRYKSIGPAFDVGSIISSGNGAIRHIGGKTGRWLIGRRGGFGEDWDAVFLGSRLFVFLGQGWFVNLEVWFRGFLEEILVGFLLDQLNLRVCQQWKYLPTFIINMKTTISVSDSK